MVDGAARRIVAPVEAVLLERAVVAVDAPASVERADLTAIAARARAAAVAARSNPLREVPRALDELERRVELIAWFSSLGEPSPWDSALHRIGALHDWPGPESEEGGSLLGQMQSWHDGLFAVIGTYEMGKVRSIVDGVSCRVAELAGRALPSDPVNDPYSAETGCVSGAWFSISILAGFLAIGWEAPDDLVELWCLFEAGHWPCAYSVSPDRVSPARLMVL